MNVSTEPMPDGSSAITFGIDLASVALPDKRYAADVAGVERDEYLVKLLFGQRKVGGIELRNLVVVSMSPKSVERLLDNSKEFMKAIEQYLDEKGIAAAPLVEISDEPGETVAMTANIVSAFRAETESTLEFYYATPEALHLLTKNHTGIAIDSIVSIDLPLAVLSTLLRALSDGVSTGTGRRDT